MLLLFIIFQIVSVIVYNVVVVDVVVHNIFVVATLA